MKGTDHNPAGASARDVSSGAPLTVALLGIGGYGQIYVNALLDMPANNGVKFIAAADPMAASCKRVDELSGKGVRLYPTPEQLFAEEKPDLVVISTPIPFHTQHIIQALASGAHVLCEKPLCATVEQGQKIIEAVKRHRKHVAIGFQWSYGKAVHQLKQDILTGVLGKPKQLRTLVLWPRDERYYSRNRWAGRIKDDNGHFVYDSPINNACAHFLHNMLYVLGSAPERSAMPVSVRAELYRAKRIQNHDVGCIQATMRDGTELLLLVAHACENTMGPLFEYEFENGTVSYDEVTAGEFVARFKDGTVKSYGRPPEANEPTKLWQTIAAIRAGENSLCSVEAAMPQIAVNCAAQDAGEIHEIADEFLSVEGEPGKRCIWVRGIDAALMRCYREFKLPSELQFAWAATRPAEVHIGADMTLQKPAGKKAMAAVSA